MEITKTRPPLSGDLNVWKKIMIDFNKKKVIVGATLEGDDPITYSCSATFEEVLTGYTPAKKQALREFFARARRMAVNNGVDPDTDLVDDDVDVEF